MALGLKRYRQLGHLHFVTFCCYLRRMHLETPEARGLFEESLERIRRRDDFQVIGYVVMPVLIHLLVSEPGRIFIDSHTSNQALSGAADRATSILAGAVLRLQRIQ
jgi:REP element-mobilizing transposase RayT